MEVEDTAAELVAGVVCATDEQTAFTDIDVALLVGARPRGPGMERKDLLQANAAIFRSQGAALDKWAKKTVKVLVVGNPANTNALIAAQNAPSIPKANFTALTRLDHNRAKGALAKRLSVNAGDIRNVIIWGNHSTTQYPDVRFATVEGAPRGHDSSSVPALVADEAWLRGEFISTIQQRGKAVIDKRGASSAASAASAIVDHVHDWMLGSSGEIVSMGVWTDGSAYGVAEGLIFSLPVVCEPGGSYRIISDLAVDEFSRGMLAKTEDELKQEREMAFAPPAPAPSPAAST